MMVRALHHRSLAAGAALTGLVIAAALLSFAWTPHSATAIVVAERLQGASASHWLGTDHFGRDVASMLMVGARNSIAVGIVAVGIGLLIGVALGALASARRGWIEEGVMRLSDLRWPFLT